MNKSLIYFVFSGIFCVAVVFDYIPFPNNGSALFAAFISGGIFGLSIVSFFQRKK